MYRHVVVVTFKAQGLSHQEVEAYVRVQVMAGRRAYPKDHPVTTIDRDSITATSLNAANLDKLLMAVYPEKEEEDHGKQTRV